MKKLRKELELEIDLKDNFPRSYANPFTFDISNVFLSSSALKRDIDFMVFALYGLSVE